MIRLFQFAFSLCLISCNYPESDQYDRHKTSQSSFQETETAEQKTCYKVIRIKYEIHLFC